jgi:SAM-dependent methyltransferase
LRKLEHPGLALPLLAALGRVRPPDGGRVLLLGCGQGEELVALQALEPPPTKLAVVGFDHAAAPLARAAARFPQAEWLLGDVNELPEGLGRFDLVVAVALLQSPAVDAGPLLRRVVQHHLNPRGGLLLGWPNGRFRDGVPVWGARTRNRREGDLALVVRDLAGHRRYLHQHRFRTHIGGGYELFLTAWREDAPGG